MPVTPILDKYVEGARAIADYSEVTQLGIDETSIAKGGYSRYLMLDRPANPA